MSNNKQSHSPKRAYRIHQKKIRRKRKLARLRSVYQRARAHARQAGEDVFFSTSLHGYLAQGRSNRPSFSETIRYLASQPEVFGSLDKVDPTNGVFHVPKIFSLTDNCQESFAFLKRLFLVLLTHRPISVQIDYQYCQRIDLDASVVLDVLLAEFIRNMKACHRSGHRTTLQVGPINYKRPEIMEILFSIGSYQTLRGRSMNFPGITPFPLRIGTWSRSDLREIDNTDLVSYISECLGKCNRTLTGDAEKELSDIIGEVLTNAEEHSTTKQRYLIGYFKLNQDQASTLGTFNLVIFNFGDTIYQKFKDPACPNQEVVDQMRALSKSYTERGLFKRLLSGPGFEEETLWTLYALQQGVTRYKDWDRGNGTMEFIESFFALKGDNLQDDNSRLTLFSGNTRIVFDGTYGPQSRSKTELDGSVKEAKVMTFNHSSNISEQPDRKFVNFADEFFPGTMISAKISIKPSNTEVKITDYESAAN